MAPDALAATHRHEDTVEELLNPYSQDAPDVTTPPGHAAAIRYDLLKDKKKHASLDKWKSHGPSPNRIRFIKADFRFMDIPLPTHMFLSNIRTGELVCYWSSSLGVSVSTTSSSARLH